MTVLEGFDSCRSDRQNLRGVLSVHVDVERKALRKRTKAARKRDAKDYLFIGGKRPYGFDVDGKCFVINEEEAETVRYIYRLKRGDEKISPQAIADILNDEGLPSPEGGKWKRGTIEGILKNWKYRGLFVHKIKVGGKKKLYTHFDRDLAIVRDRKWKKLCRKYVNYCHAPNEAGCAGRCTHPGVR